MEQIKVVYVNKNEPSLIFDSWELVEMYCRDHEVNNSVWTQEIIYERAA